MITSEFRNEKEYQYAYLLSFYLVLRLLVKCNGATGVYFTTCGFFFFIIIIYCIIDRKKYYLTFLFIILLVPVCLFLESNILMLLTLMLVILPIFFSNIDFTKGQAKFFHFFLPISIIVMCQLFGYRNISQYFQYFNEYAKIEFGLDLFWISDNSILDFSLIDEYKIVKNIYIKLLQAFGYLKSVY